MLFISAAMQHEAKELISGLNLKKNHYITRFRVYDSESCALIVTGTGKVRSAVATTFLLTHYSAGPDDFWTNTGICGAASKKIKSGTLYIINRIRDHETGRDMFPDMLYLHDFKESSLETFSLPVTEAASPDRRSELVDMEASGAFEAAKAFLPLHRLAVLKIVLDHMDPVRFDSRDVETIMAARTSRITDWLLKVSDQPSRSCDRRMEQQELKAATRFDMSTSMKNELKSLLRYLQLADPDKKSQASALLYSRLMEDGRVARKEVKKIIADLRMEAMSLPAPIK